MSSVLQQKSLDLFKSTLQAIVNNYPLNSSQQVEFQKLADIQKIVTRLKNQVLSFASKNWVNNNPHIFTSNITFTAGVNFTGNVPFITQSQFENLQTEQSNLKNEIIDVQTQITNIQSELNNQNNYLITSLHKIIQIDGSSGIVTIPLISLSNNSSQIASLYPVYGTTIQNLTIQFSNNISVGTVQRFSFYIPVILIENDIYGYSYITQYTFLDTSDTSNRPNTSDTIPVIINSTFLGNNNNPVFNSYIMQDFTIFNINDSNTIITSVVTYF